jgi:hypothetical protein
VIREGRSRTGVSGRVVTRSTAYELEYTLIEDGESIFTFPAAQQWNLHRHNNEGSPLCVALLAGHCHAAQTRNREQRSSGVGAVAVLNFE